MKPPPPPLLPDDAAIVIPEPIRPAIVAGLAAIDMAPSFGLQYHALAALFTAALPPLLSYYVELGLLIDKTDLERATKTGLPALLCEWIADVLAPNEPASRLYRRIASHVRRTVLLLRDRLDPPGNHIKLAGNPEEWELLGLLILEDAITDFAASILIAGPPRPEPTKEQRKEARERRLKNFIAVRAADGQAVTFSTVCRSAGVERHGRGSGAQWKNGTLPDSAKTSREIEKVLRFETPLKFDADADAFDELPYSMSPTGSRKNGV